MKRTIIALWVLVLATGAAAAQDRWLHIRVQESDGTDESISPMSSTRNNTIFGLFSSCSLLQDATSRIIAAMMMVGFIVFNFFIDLLMYFCM